MIKDKIFFLINEWTINNNEKNHMDFIEYVEGKDDLDIDKIFENAKLNYIIYINEYDVEIDDENYNINIIGKTQEKWNGNKKALTDEDLDNEDNYYKISDAKQLAWLADCINNKYDDGIWATKNYKLINDIELDSYEKIQWTMIGTSENPFDGIFNGQGYNIKNLYVNNENLDRFGLFGQINSNATIKNIKLVNCDITAGYRTGGILGANKGGNVENCFVSGKISCLNGRHIGGIVGTNTSGNIIRCCSSVKVEGLGYVGGIAGITHSGNVLDSYNIKSIKGKGNFVGGITGYLAGNMENCYNVGTITGGGLTGENASINNTKNVYFLDTSAPFRY